MIVFLLLEMLIGFGQVAYLLLYGIETPLRYALQGISGYMSNINPYIASIGSFVNLSTLVACLGIIIMLEIVIRGWEVISTIFLRK